MSVGAVEVRVLGLHRDREDDVGEVGRVGEALLEDDREEVFPGEPSPDARLVRVARGRVRVEDDHGRHRRVGLLGERLPQPGHVDRARVGGR
jgi:hypothetical protein